MERLSQHGFHAGLAASKGASLVVFTMVGCGTCAGVKRALLDAKLPCRLFEVDAHEAAGVAASLEVFHLPALFLYVDGAYHAPIHSLPNTAALVDAVNRALAAPPQEEP